MPPKKTASKKPDVPTLVYTEIIGRKNYITKTRPYHVPGKILPDYNADISLAKVYSSLKKAKEAIHNIHNIHNREFFTEPANQ